MKILSYFTMFLLLAFITQAELVDDFESYDFGNINDVTTNWVGSEDDGGGPAKCTIEWDSVDNSNKVIQFAEGGGVGQMWVRSTLSPTAAIDVDETSTVYFRAKVTSAIDSSFGLTDLDTASNDWGHFRLQFVFHNAMQIRASAGVQTLAYAGTGTQVPWNTDWYNIWLVVTNNTTTPVVKVYINQTDVDATEADRCVNLANLPQNTFDFRVPAAGALDHVFWRAQNNTSNRMVQIDNLNITTGTDLSIPVGLKPYSPTVEQGTPSGSNIPTTLKWKAAPDPGEIYAVNPDIVDQYVFIGTDIDPNLVYSGATGTDPGTDDPNSQYSFTGTVDRTYYWAVVEAIEGHEQTFTAGVSKIDLVDPNNIVGSTWSYEATKSAPVITTGLVDARVFTSDPEAVFKVDFSSAVNPVTVTWYKDDVELTGSETDVSIVTDAFASSTLTIDTPTLADEGKYYAKLSVSEGTDDDIYTATRLLVIKLELAEYTFDTAANRLADTGDIGAEPGKAPAQGKQITLPDANSLLASNVTLSYDIGGGINGTDAVLLNGTQYIDLDPNGYPKAGLLDTIGDARGPGYEKQGFGRGMDQGSILCWIRPTSIGAVYTNANGSDNTHFGLTTPATDQARGIVRGSNWDNSYQEIGTAAGSLNMTDFSLQDGQWHMFAATWNDSGIRVYINGEQVATTAAGVPEIYTPWERSNLVGASRSASPGRWILNSLYTGAIDSLRVYNYVKTLDEIATEYESVSGNTPCSLHTFEGNEYNFDNSASSYCKVDLADFAMFASKWMHDGYTAP